MGRKSLANKNIVLLQSKYFFEGSYYHFAFCFFFWIWVNIINLHITFLHIFWSLLNIRFENRHSVLPIGPSLSTEELIRIENKYKTWLTGVEKLNLFITIPATERQKSMRGKHKTHRCGNTNHTFPYMLKSVQGFVTTKASSAKQGRQAGNTSMQLFTKIRIPALLTSCYIKVNRWKTWESNNKTPKCWVTVLCWHCP